MRIMAKNRILRYRDHPLRYIEEHLKRKAMRQTPMRAHPLAEPFYPIGGGGSNQGIEPPSGAIGAVLHRGSTVATGGVWEAVTGLTNGINLRFDTAAAYKAGSLNVFVNGQQAIPVQDYDETTPATGRFDMVEAPTPIDTVSVIYEEP
jgi:hypothetical protein